MELDLSSLDFSFLETSQMDSFTQEAATAEFLVARDPLLRRGSYTHSYSGHRPVEVARTRQPDALHHEGVRHQH